MKFERYVPGTYILTLVNDEDVTVGIRRLFNRRGNWDDLLHSIDQVV